MRDPLCDELPFAQERSINSSFLKTFGFLFSAYWLATFCPLVTAEILEDEVSPLVQASCLDCHGEGSETGLELDSLTYDLTDPHVFEKWVKVFDRVRSGEMPPESEERPDIQLLDDAVVALQRELKAVNRKSQQRNGRVRAKRLTKLEYGYTLKDLLLIPDRITDNIPDEVSSEDFDTLGKTQRISPVHMASYLEAADLALESALKFGELPTETFVFDFQNSEFLNSFHELEATQGGNISRKIDDGVALFFDNDYLLSSKSHQFKFERSGVYRISTKVAAYQSRKPVTYKLIRKEPSGAATIIKAVDLVPGETKVVETEAYFDKGDSFYPSLENVKRSIALLFLVGAKNHKGPGLAIYDHRIEGPVFESWPPASTKLLVGDDRSDGNIVAAVRRTLERLGPQIFRRPIAGGELDPFVDLIRENPSISTMENLSGQEEQIAFAELLRVPLRAMLTSPQFLIFGYGQDDFDDYALANRLSYFLWKSMPDAELYSLAAEGKLKDTDTLRRQVERMLKDKKSDRFIDDFLGQWLLLSKINATTPDAGLYPEYDEILGQAMPQETKLFFRALIEENLSVKNLIDSDFTFLNRPLARLYRIRNVKGLELRKVSLPASSPRGGVLTQAAILKTTANGTVTSPVTRGNFVLSNFLGTPPSPPPPNIGSIEPDTRGTTTIRELLSAHREDESCNSCHQVIDPPGFALESFNPIGAFRKNYRASTITKSVFGENKSFTKGPVVDASGTSADGQTFEGIDDYKSLLMEKKELVAKNFVEKLIAYSTGGQVEFADREVVRDILDKNRETDFRVRDLVHAIVASRLFLEK